MFQVEIHSPWNIACNRSFVSKNGKAIGIKQACEQIGIDAKRFKNKSIPKKRKEKTSKEQQSQDQFIAQIASPFPDRDALYDEFISEQLTNFDWTMNV